MRTLKLHFPHDALPTLDTFLQQTKEARLFRRAQAVRAVVKGQRLQTVSDTLQFTYSALRKWVHRFAHQGTQGLVDRPRSGRPPQITCELEQRLCRKFCSGGHERAVAPVCEGIKRRGRRTVQPQ